MNTAATLLKDLGLGFSKRVFPSGVAVIQSDEYDEKAVAERLRQLISSKAVSDASTGRNGNVGGLTALAISQEWNISVLLAMEQLQSAERLGYLCRDSLLEGISFFDNKFNIW
jgi:ESCRT-II complex subunit VPS36